MIKKSEIQSSPEQYRSKAVRFFQFLIIAIGVSFFVWGINSSKFRDPEGFFRSYFCLVMTVSFALILLGSFIGGYWRKAVCWFALALVGQAVALQLIDAGPFVRYQHYKKVSDFFDPFVLLLAGFLVVQAGLVMLGLKEKVAVIWQWVRNNFKTWQLICIGIAFVLTSAVLSRKPSVYITELIVASLIQAIGLANFILVAITLPREKLERFKNKLATWLDSDKTSARLDRFVLLAAIYVAFLAATLNVISYERHPHIPDEVVYLYHANYFSQGYLTLPALPVPRLFDMDLMYYEEGRWYCPVPPGWPAMLAVGYLLGAPWLVNPILAAVNVILAYLLLLEIYDRRTARLSLFLICFSPWYIFMAMNFMTHTFTLTCALIAALAIARLRRQPKAKWAWIGGIAIGLTSLIRPLDGMIIAILMGLWALGIKGFKTKLKLTSNLVGATILTAAVVLPYNKLLTGQATKYPIMTYIDKYYTPGANSIGFGANRGLGWTGLDPFPGHGIVDVFINANLNLFALNIELFGWSTGSILLILILLLSRKVSKSDYLMLAGILVTIGINSFYWFSGGPDFGARYWFLIIIPCIALTARSIGFLEERIRKSSKVGFEHVRLNIGIMLICFAAFINFSPWRAIDKYHHYRGMRPDIRYLDEKYDFGKSIVFIRGENKPDYMSASVYNPVNIFTDETFYVWDENSKVRENVVREFPDRSVWIVDGPSLTKRGYEVVAGPLSAQESLSMKNENRVGNQHSNHHSQ